MFLGMTEANMSCKACNAMPSPLRISGRHHGLDDVDQTLDLHIGPQTSYGIRRQAPLGSGWHDRPQHALSGSHRFRYSRVNS
jgi:hypothetical protein